MKLEKLTIQPFGTIGSPTFSIFFFLFPHQVLDPNTALTFWQWKSINHLMAALIVLCTIVTNFREDAQLSCINHNKSKGQCSADISGQSWCKATGTTNKISLFLLQIRGTCCIMYLCAQFRIFYTIVI